MWEFGHAQEITSHHTSGSYQRVTRARFSPHGNKVGHDRALFLLAVTGMTFSSSFMFDLSHCICIFKVGISDASGQLLLWQVSSTSTSSDPFLVRNHLVKLKNK